uniref:hypothetical protein n=1 Tax=unclassified Brevundimonas TaxID=2622653 RepID=UPI0025C12878
MSCKSDDVLPIHRALALLAAVVAVMVGSLMPFAALAAARPGQPVVLCTSEGLQTIHIGGLDGPIKQDIGAKCAACVMPMHGAVLPPPAPEVKPPVRYASAVVYAPLRLA